MSLRLVLPQVVRLLVPFRPAPPRRRATVAPFASAQQPSDMAPKGKAKAATKAAGGVTKKKAAPKAAAAAAPAADVPAGAVVVEACKS